MGLNCVAVLLNDKCHEIEQHGGAIGARMSRAMQDWNPATREGNFGVGSVISRDHADGFQITCVQGNSGCHITVAQNLPRYALEQLAACLRRHGWTVKAPRRARKASNPQDGA